MPQTDLIRKGDSMYADFLAKSAEMVIVQDPGYQSLIKRGDGLFNESIQTTTLWRTL